VDTSLTKKTKPPVNHTQQTGTVDVKAKEVSSSTRTIRTDVLFQTIDKLGSWKVFLAGQAVRHMEAHHKSGNLKIITKKILYGLINFAP
jgi:hypothetical protein